jgi:hypothetical protein
MDGDKVHDIRIVVVASSIIVVVSFTSLRSPALVALYELR